MFRARPRLTGTLIGLLVTSLSTAAFFALDVVEVLELWTFDWRIRHCNTLLPASPIVHVDIDDGSLERIGRWPWRRHDLARLIDTLSGMKPADLLIDLLLTEYERPLLDDPRYGAFSDVEPDVPILGDIAESNVVFGDLELAAALRTAGNAVLSAQLEVALPGQPLPLRHRIAEGIAAGRLPTADEALAGLPPAVLGHAGADTLVRREWLRLRAADLLAADFSLPPEDLARRLGEEVTDVLAGAKKLAALRRVASCFAPGRIPTRDEVLQAVLPGRRDRLDSDRIDVLTAYRRQRGIQALLASMHPAPAEAPVPLTRILDILAPHYLLGEAARDIAAVNFSTDPDGLVRRVPLMIRHDDSLYLDHLGFLAGRRIRRWGEQAIRLRAGPRLAIDGAGVEIPLDRRGNMIIHWAATAANWRTGADFPHLPAAKFLELADARSQITQNDLTAKYLLADVVAAARGELQVTTAPGEAAATHHADHAFRLAVNELAALQARLAQARLRGHLSPAELSALRERHDQLLAKIETDHSRAAIAVEMACAELDQLGPEEIARDPGLAEEARRFRGARDILQKQIPLLRSANLRHEETIRRLASELAPAIAGRHVFLGFAATAEGDIVSTPIDPRTNGVMCHAHVLNTILQNRFITPVPAWLEITLCTLLGAIVSLITATRSPRTALAATALLFAAYLGLNAWVLFRRFDIWLALAAPLATLCVAWAFVTLFRQLTAERDRRVFAKQLGQYTSPAIAARIAESPRAAAAFKTVQTREMTILFTDLAGFTTMSEQENPEVVQHVLNTYLQRMSLVIWSRRGLINKFMGDGIMAFFNPSVDPLPDHPRAACETCLVALEELERLKAETATDPAARLFGRLSMRIGLSTGLCKNGDLGSELKADYTVIGDVVNLAARLEPANKVFGTRILVSGPVRDAVREDYEFRYLAELQVKGKAATVPAWEMIARRGQLSAGQREYITQFEAGVALYQQRRWDECIVHFTRMLARRPDDPGASRYIDACQEFKQFPPDDAWRGALELKEK
jgi:class 3 adenylate cyclase/CHASE2 domain-containing sensor protein